MGVVCRLEEHLCTAKGKQAGDLGTAFVSTDEDAEPAMRRFKHGYLAAGCEDTFGKNLAVFAHISFGGADEKGRVVPLA